MDESLTKKDLEFILESLKYTKLNFEEYQKYPSYEYKQQRINEAQQMINKVQKLKKERAD